MIHHGEFEMGIMGSLIREVHDTITDKHAAIFYERKQIISEREKVKTSAKVVQQKNNGRYPLWEKKKLDTLGSQLIRVREKINSLSVRTTKYQLILKGSEALNRFLGWAQAGGWYGNKRPDSHFLKG